MMGEGMEILHYVELSSQLLVVKSQWRVKEISGEARAFDNGMRLKLRS